jgi:hypothetical protein
MATIWVGGGAGRRVECGFEGAYKAINIMECDTTIVLSLKTIMFFLFFKGLAQASA